MFPTITNNRALLLHTIAPAVQKTNIIDFLLSQVQVCLSCGANVGIEQTLCRYCLRTIDAQSRSGWNSNYNFKTLSLYEWNDSSRRVVIPTIRKLKGSYNLRLYWWFAERLAQKRFQLFEEKDIWKKNIFFVPAPPRVLNKKDHAWCLANALMRTIGGHLLDVLVRLKTDQQKKNTLPARWSDLNKRMSQKQGFNVSGHDEDLFIFIDDLVTTGATAMAAHMTLGCPKNYEVWTIFNRPSLRLNRGFDITHHE